MAGLFFAPIILQFAQSKGIARPYSFVCSDYRAAFVKGVVLKKEDVVFGCGIIKEYFLLGHCCQWSSIIDHHIRKCKMPHRMHQIGHNYVKGTKSYFTTGLVTLLTKYKRVISAAYKPQWEHR